MGIYKKFTNSEADIVSGSTWRALACARERTSFAFPAASRFSIAARIAFLEAFVRPATISIGASVFAVFLDGL